MKPKRDSVLTQHCSLCVIQINTAHAVISTEGTTARMQEVEQRRERLPRNLKIPRCARNDTAR